ncbi:hypothetical protein HanXRQr2_Chr04g0144891 [Helianthus annuus]|uniref:Uncharacterized protein n=1 Tax=Helianthus annuus TaxID=4232 RepID=A0A9K3J4X0_HELAN|nr:hypothetical protein HanXRQr2_Chr04g0144891 [Helianthus annuus]
MAFHFLIPLFLPSHPPPPLQILLIFNESSSICSSQDLPPPHFNVIINGDISSEDPIA